jgi:pentatricopeptide repeat domain-containing protein 1
MCWLDVEDGFTVVAAMRELGLRPSRISLEALLDGCAAMSDPEQAQRVVQEMEQEGLCLNIFSMIRYQLMPSPLNLAIHLCVLSPHNS